MTSLTASRLLAIWERGLNRPLLWKIHQLLAAAFPGLDARTAGTLSIGERDARLLMVREYLFGTLLLNLANCPQCAGPLEWQVNTCDIRLQSPRDPDPDQEYIPEQFSLQSGEYEVRFRLPGDHDIDAVLSANRGSGTSPSAGQLLERCIISATLRGKSIQAGQLPGDVREAICRRMEDQDPQAVIDMLLDCPQCGHSWNACFDIAGYLWEEIHRWALRMFHTIHLLAKTYHWSEKEILDLSPQRRQMYLRMIDSGG